MFKTAMTELFGVRHPIIQSGMQRVATAELVAAVANAGALGFLSALTQPSPADLKNEIKKTQQLTDQPFGVNLTLLPTQQPVDYEGYARVIAQSGVRVVETAGRSPEALMPLFHAAGIKMIHKCTSVKHALKAEKLGCAAITIDGFEAAGHPGEQDVPSLVLVPRAVDQLSVPVIACGGFADGRGLIAALALGACGIAMGTRFMATEEAPVHPALKHVLIEAGEADTQLILRSFRNTARVYRNDVAVKVAQQEAVAGTQFSDIAAWVSGAKGAEVLASGDLSQGIFWTGISQGLITDAPSVSQLVERIIAQALASQRAIQSKVESGC